jgi:prevent-host-death family protein
VDRNIEMANNLVIRRGHNPGAQVHRLGEYFAFEFNTRVGGQFMHTKTVDVREAQTNLRDLLSLVREGTEIVLTDSATPLARVVPIAFLPCRVWPGYTPGLFGPVMISMNRYQRPSGPDRHESAAGHPRLYLVG